MSLSRRGRGRTTRISSPGCSGRGWRASPFSDEDLGALPLTQEAAAQAFKGAASEAKPELVLASALSAGHALGQAEPRVRSLQPMTAQPEVSAQQAMTRAGASFHPNEAGMAAIAAELRRVLTA